MENHLVVMYQPIFIQIYPIYFLSYLFLTQFNVQSSSHSDLMSDRIHAYPDYCYSHYSDFLSFKIVQKLLLKYFKMYHIEDFLLI